MATIKSYTDIEQSKKLAEILPLETTDMCYVATHLDENDNLCYSTTPIILQERVAKFKTGVPCWSLAALLGVLPMITKDKNTANPFIAKTPDSEYYVVYATLTKEVESSAIYDNPVDACYEMIIRLHESNLL